MHIVMGSKIRANCKEFKDYVDILNELVFSKNVLFSDDIRTLINLLQRTRETLENLSEAIGEQCR